MAQTDPPRQRLEEVKAGVALYSVPVLLAMVGTLLMFQIRSVSSGMDRMLQKQDEQGNRLTGIERDVNSITGTIAADGHAIDRLNDRVNCMERRLDYMEILENPLPRGSQMRPMAGPPPPC